MFQREICCPVTHISILVIKGDNCGPPNYLDPGDGALQSNYLTTHSFKIDNHISYKKVQFCCFYSLLKIYNYFKGGKKPH